MKNEKLEQCIELNKFLKSSGLVKLTWGNASAMSEDKLQMAIKPSGIDVFNLHPLDLSIIEISTGEQVSGLKKSVDTEIHLEIYRSFPETKFIVHNHSKFATSFAQAGQEIPILGTTHADYFPGNIPIVPCLSQDEYDNYESSLGVKTVKTIRSLKNTPNNIRAILLENHGVLLFSDSLKIIKESAIVLEEIAEMAFYTSLINPNRKMTQNDHNLFKKHFDRKNGKNKYYGQ